MSSDTKVKVEIWNDKCKYKSKIDNGDVFYLMKHKDIYRFKFISTDSRLNLIEIFLEGEIIGKWVIDPNSVFFIERPSKLEKKFCCMRIDSSEVRKSNVQHSQTNGLIEIRIKPFIKPHDTIPNIVVDSPNNDSSIELSFGSEIEADGGSFETTDGDECGTKPNTQKGTLHTATTMLVDNSNQKFQKYDMKDAIFYDEDNYTMYIRLLVEEEEYIPIKQLKEITVKQPAMFPTS